MNLLEISVSGAVFILAVVIIRAAAINHLPKKTFLILWEAVLLRLMIPFSIPSIFSAYTLIPYGYPVIHAPLGQANFIRQGISRRISDFLLSPFFKAAAAPATSAVSWESLITMQAPDSLPANSPSVSVWFLIWCAGMIFLAVFFILSYLRCRTEFRTALPISNAYVEQWLKERPIKRHISIKQLDRISTPLTYGIFRPVILMPKKTDWENVNQLQYILTHEYAHICHFDAVTKLAAAFVLCIHWFNPFVWVMYMLLNRDMELACDESVIKQLGEKSKSAYSNMLICMEAEKSGLPSFYSNFSKNAVEERITAIMHVKPTTPAAFLSACFIIFAALSLFATSPAASTGSSLTEIFAFHEPQANTKILASDSEKSMSIIHESADILYYEDGEPYIHDILTNNTDKAITEIQYCMLAYNKNGSPLKLYWYYIDSSEEASFENIVRSKRKILSNETEEYRGGWSLYHGNIIEDFPKVYYAESSQAAYSLVYLKQVVFEDGSFWNNPDYESWFQTYAGKEIDVDELQNYYPHEYRIESADILQ